MARGGRRSRRGGKSDVHAVDTSPTLHCADDAADKTGRYAQRAGQVVGDADGVAFINSTGHCLADISVKATCYYVAASLGTHDRVTRAANVVNQ